MSRLDGWEELPNKEKHASAVDTDLNGEYVCLGGPRRLTIIKPCRPSPVKRHLAKFQKLNILKWQKETNKNGSYIAVTGGSQVYIYQFNNGDLKEIYTECAHPYVIEDFDWSSKVPDLFATCSVRDNIKIWDLRQKSLSLQLKSISGAVQSKWAFHQEAVICTATGADIRLWDLRQPKFPTQLVEAHIDKVNCLTWLPKRPSSFVSAGFDCYIKFWNASDLSKPFRSIGKLEDPVWKLQFSYNGDEFATLSKRSYGKENFSNTVTVFKTKDPMRFQTLKSKEDDIIDICWRGAVKKRPTDCLFSVSKSGRLHRFEINTLSVADIRVPIAAPEDDDDLQAAESTFIVNKQKPSVEASPSQYLGQHERSISGGSEKYGYRTYVRVTNVGNSIGTELNILSALKAPGLSVDEINYERAIVAFTYSHAPSGKKIRLHLRFNASNAKFHKLLLEITESEFDLDEERASMLLELLRKHIANYKSDGSDDTAIASGLKNFSNFVELLKIFVPEAGVSEVESLLEDDQLTNEKILSTEIFAAHDDLVPSPRTCGASFNGSGLLVVFGRAGKKKEEVKVLPLMFASDTKQYKRLADETLKMTEDRHLPSSVDQHQIPGSLFSLPYSRRSTPSDRRLSRVYDDGDFFPMSMPSSITRSTAKRDSLAESSSRMKMTINSRTSDLYESSTEIGVSLGLEIESVSDLSRVSVSAPLVIVRSQRHSSNSRTGVLAAEHYMIAEAKLVSKIVVYDASELLPVSKVLARSYRLQGGTPLEICLHNMKVAEKAARLDLFQIWNVVELWVRTALQGFGQPSKLDKSSLGEGLFVPVDDSQFWDSHPCGVSLLQDLLDHCEKIGDYQTAAMILCTIAPRFAVKNRAPSLRSEMQNELLTSSGFDSKSLQLKSSYSATEYQDRSGSHLRKVIAKKSMPKAGSEKKKVSSITSPCATPALSTSAPAAMPDSPARKFSFFLIGRKPRASAVTTAVADSPSSSQVFSSSGKNSVIGLVGVCNEMTRNGLQDSAVEQTSVCENFNPDSSVTNPLHRLVTFEVRQRMSRFLQSYIEMLYRWRIYTKATELLKFSENAPRSQPLFVAYDNRCCGRGCGRVNCFPPRPPFYCAVCHIIVKGLLTTCAACKHGGHIEHLALWFQDNTHCPTGCRCQCLKYR